MKIRPIALIVLLCVSCYRPASDSCDIPDSLFPLGNELDSIECSGEATDEKESMSETLDDPRFVIVTQLDSTILTDIRYATSNNFIGRPLNGYNKPLAILTRQAAEALVRANAELRSQGYAILIYDAYRPQRAVEDIIRWSYDTKDTLMRQQYYPQLTKLQIRQQGYISKHSKHAMGSTVDVTLFDLNEQKIVDMGSPFDFFSSISNYSSPLITPQQRSNRKMLRTVMGNNGFYPIEAEWWHFTLRHQPYTQPFDFEIGKQSIL